MLLGPMQDIFVQFVERTDTLCTSKVERTGSNGIKSQRKYELAIRKNLCRVRIVKQ